MKIENFIVNVYCLIDDELKVKNCANGVLGLIMSFG